MEELAADITLKVWRWDRSNRRSFYAQIILGQLRKAGRYG
jgi:hypothetical protein